MSALTKEKKSSVLLMGELMDKAEKKARTRENKSKELLNEKVVDVNNKLRELEEYAETMGLGVHKKRQRSNIKHVQFIQENWAWIKEQDLLTTAEKAFLVDIVDLVQFGSNAICKKTKIGQSSCSISELSKLLKTDIKHIRNIVNYLTDKGILCIAETGIDAVHPKNEEEQHPAKAKMIFVNPRLIHSGYNDDVNESLQIMFKKSLTKVPVKMF